MIKTRAVIFLNGDKPSKSLIQNLITSQDFIICADGGANHAVSCGITPNVIIGDQDSLDPAIKAHLSQNPITWLRYPEAKNETDSELVISYALEQGYTNLLFFGFFGDRIDHVLSNIFFLTVLAQKATITILEEKRALHIVTKKFSIGGKRGECISLIPLVSNVTGITTEGLKYKLHNETLFFGKTRGMSNEFIKERAEIRIKDGILLVVHTF